jgi:hypothetical protein
MVIRGRHPVQAMGKEKNLGLRTLKSPDPVPHCCILIVGNFFLLSAVFNAAPAQAKWWKIFHLHHKQDSIQQQQVQPTGTTAAPGTSYASRRFLPPPAPTASSSMPPINTVSGSSLPSGQMVPPSAEPPPLPVRPPIPDPPQVTCPAPLGSGVPKPALAWRAKSIRQLAAASSNATPGLSAGDHAVTSIRNPAYNGAARSTASGVSLSKTFLAKFDDTFMAAILACSRSGFAIRSMDSTQGKLEAVSSDPRLHFSLSLQLSRDLLDTTNVNCYCTAQTPVSRVLVGNLLSNINGYLNSQANAGKTAAALIPQTGTTTSTAANLP